MRTRMLLSCMTLLAAAGCGKLAPPPAATPPPPGVVVAAVEQRDVPMVVEWIGTTVGFVNAQIHPKVQGYLLAQHYTNGALVHKDELLFTIDPRQFQAARNQSAAQLNQAKAALKRSCLNVERYTPLSKEGAVSRQELDDAVQGRDANQAAVEGAQAALEQAELNLAWTRVTSPIEGFASISAAQIGNLVNEQTLLMSVVQVDPIKVQFPISEREYLALMRRPQPGPAHVPVAAQLILADGSIFGQTGHFLDVDNQVDLKTGTLLVEGSFPNPGGVLRPGQFAKVRAAVRTIAGALLIPQCAVQDAQGASQVYVVGPDQKVSVRTITLAGDWENKSIVASGLQAGEQVVVDGLQKVRSGMLVKPGPAAAAPAGAPASAPHSAPAGR